MALDAPERLMLVLPVDAQQLRRQVAEQRQGGLRTVHERARPSAGRDDAANDDFLAALRRRDAGRGERLAHRRRHAGEHRFDDRLLGARPHDVGVGAAAERDVERRQQDRLAGTRLAGEHVQPGLEVEVQPVDDGQIGDVQAAQHPSAS